MPNYMRYGHAYCRWSVFMCKWAFDLVYNNNYHFVAITQIRASLQKHADFDFAPGLDIQVLAALLYSKKLITKPTKESPTTHSILNEIRAPLPLSRTISELKERYQKFLDSLDSAGILTAQKLSFKLAEDFKLVLQKSKC